MTSRLMGSADSELGSCLTKATRDKPMCAGVLIVNSGRFLLALGTPDRWEDRQEGIIIPVTGIGGGQEPCEDLTACAQREAQEELGCLVDLRHSPITFVEIPDEPVKVARFEGEPAPILFQVQRRATSAPFAPGMPAGDRLHIGIFRAVPSARPRPADVPALLYVPPPALAVLCRGVKLPMLASLGIDLECSAALPENAVLAIPRSSTERMLADVIGGFGLDAIGEWS